MLEYHSYARAELRQIGLPVSHRDAGNRDGALLERLQAVDTFDQRRLPRPGGAAHHHDLALRDLGRAILEHLEVLIPLAHLADRDHWRGPMFQRMAMRFCSLRTRREAAKQMTK